MVAAVARWVGGGCVWTEVCWRGGVAVVVVVVATVVAVDYNNDDYLIIYAFDPRVSYELFLYELNTIYLLMIFLIRLIVYLELEFSYLVVLVLLAVVDVVVLSIFRN